MRFRMMMRYLEEKMDFKLLEKVQKDIEELDKQRITKKKTERFIEFRILKMI